MTFNPLTTTAADLTSRLASGSLTSVQILKVYLAQIAKHNHAGQKLNAIINIAPEDVLFKQAEKLDEERKAGKLRGPLHGLPTVVKDCFVFDKTMGLETTAGSWCFVGAKGKGNAVVIQQLIDQGIIILGTANMTEFCGHKGNAMSPGWSAVGGQTRSAYDAAPPGGDVPPFHGATSGGSSAGSGVSVSAGFVPFSIGTETGGSLIYPASKAGLYAMRPTLGSVSAKGCFRISKSFDGVGAMAKTPSDLALVIESILTNEAKTKVPVGGYGTVMKGKEGWEGLRVGFCETTWGGVNEKKWGSEHIKSIYENAIETIRKDGSYVLYPATPPAPSTLKHEGKRSMDVAYYEFNDTIREFCNEFENPKVKNLEDIIKFNEEHRAECLPEPHTSLAGLTGSFSSSLTPESSSTIHAAIRKLAIDGMGGYMDTNGLDMIITGSDHELVNVMASAGWPSATVPLGNMEDGNDTPFGLFLCVRGGREDLLFRFMSAWEGSMEKIKLPKLSTDFVA